MSTAAAQSIASPNTMPPDMIDMPAELPWGINGGMYGGTSEKYILRVGANEPERIPSKFDNLKVEPGDRIIYRTAGSGGWGDPYERPADQVARDVRHDLVSKEMAAERYGVVLTAAIEVDEEATEKTRNKLRNARGEAPKFDFGPLPESIMAAAD